VICNTKYNGSWIPRRHKQNTKRENDSTKRIHRDDCVTVFRHWHINASRLSHEKLSNDLVHSRTTPESSLQVIGNSSVAESPSIATTTPTQRPGLKKAMLYQRNRIIVKTPPLGHSFGIGHHHNEPRPTPPTGPTLAQKNVHNTHLRAPSECLHMLQLGALKRAINSMNHSLEAHCAKGGRGAVEKVHMGTLGWGCAELPTMLRARHLLLTKGTPTCTEHSPGAWYAFGVAPKELPRSKELRLGTKEWRDHEVNLLLSKVVASWV